MGRYYVKTRKSSISFLYKKKTIKRLIGIFLVSVGIVIFIYFFFPIVSYQIFIESAFSNSNIEVPIPKYLVVKKSGTFGSLISQGFASLTSDFTDARNWYPSFPSDTHNTLKVDSYMLSIPRLKIENAIVSTKDYDLSRHLIQYFGTSIPGENGTAVIFGHSTLPQLFDPKNYKTIFATLHTIKIGDEIEAIVNGIGRKYKVFSITITSADDTNILSQSFDRSYITLITCTPPGTVWKRLVVRASLDSL